MYNYKVTIKHMNKQTIFSSKKEAKRDEVGVGESRVFK